MANSNESLFIKLNRMINSLDEEKICKIAGEKLVDNIRKETNDVFKKGNSKWNYEYHGSFQTDNVTYYEQSNKEVVINHPAAKRLEYGLKEDLEITPKKAKVLSYIGDDGKRWFSTKEVIPKNSCPPLGYAKRSINKTKKEMHKEIKDILNGSN